MQCSVICQLFEYKYKNQTFFLVHWHNFCHVVPQLLLIFFADAYENGYIMDGHLTPEYIDENGMYDGQTYDGQPYDGHGQPFMPYGYVYRDGGLGKNGQTFVSYEYV